jgi:hypothetical protein
MTQLLRSSRRKLLANLGLGGAGLVASSWAGSASALGTISPLANLLPNLSGSLQTSGLRQWSGAVGSTFLVLGEAGPVAMILAAVKPLSAPGVRPAGLRTESFTLIFEGAAGPKIPAGDQTYTFQQSGGNQLRLFVGAKVAVGTKAQLIAVMN